YVHMWMAHVRSTSPCRSLLRPGRLPLCSCARWRQWSRPFCCASSPTRLPFLQASAPGCVRLLLLDFRQCPSSLGPRTGGTNAEIWCSIFAAVFVLHVSFGLPPWSRSGKGTGLSICFALAFAMEG